MTSSTQKRASSILKTRPSVLEDTYFDEEFSAHEYSGSFTVITPKSLNNMTTANDDTDIEADDGFNEYSEVTFEKTCDKPAKEMKHKQTIKSPKKGAESISASSKPPPCLQSSRCSTQCASTYRNRRKISAAAQFNKMLVSDDSDENSAATTARRRKVGKFRASKSIERKLIEGTFKLSESMNYEEYLAGIGTGPFTQDLVMRAGMILRINQELDKQWRISTETLIKAKSVRGYRTNNRKWTENKFKVGEEKPEVLDDWDQRLVVTLLEVNDQGNRLTLQQVAEKDQFLATDSLVELEVDSKEPDILIMTCKVDDVVAWRKFERQLINSKFSERKSSSPF